MSKLALAAAASDLKELRMKVLCLDLEGVLVPEIWIGLAERTGIESLRATTRDVPDYDQLMRDEKHLRVQSMPSASG